MWVYDPTMCGDSVGTGRELTFMEKHRLCVRRLLGDSHTPYTKAHEGSVGYLSQVTQGVEPGLESRHLNQNTWP